MLLGLLIFFGGYWAFVLFFAKVVRPWLDALGGGEPERPVVSQGVIVRAAIRRNATLRDVETGRQLVADADALMSCRPKDVRSN